MKNPEDIILITIDCWRDDALDYMPNLTGLTADWGTASVICASPHTGGAFPAIFCSSYYPEVYSNEGTVQDNVTSLPQLLANQGYSTAGFVASNPVTARWSTHFDKWWNDGIFALDDNEDSTGESRSKVAKAQDFLTIQPHVSASDVFARADDWWESESSPRFLWVHLMEPHSPYLPGFRRGAKIGLLKTYVSLFANATHRDNDNYHGTFPDWIQQHLKRLYIECVKELDSMLSEWLKSHHDDAAIVLTGDHGEEFDHGVITHARLYDETVKVPFLTNQNFSSRGDLVRQIDIAPTICEQLDLPQPTKWEGTSIEEGFSSQLMIGSLEQHDQYWLGIRSENWKLIKPFDVNAGFEETEVYNLADDSDENHSRPESAAPDELHERLDSFIERENIQKEITENIGFTGGVDSSVETRLQELGYTN